MKVLLIALIWTGSLMAMSKEEYEHSSRMKSKRYVQFLKVLSILQEQQEQEDNYEPSELLLRRYLTPLPRVSFLRWQEEEDTDYIVLSKNDFDAA